MNSNVTSPLQADELLSPTGSPWGRVLRKHWQRSPERFAWVVMLASFGIFAILFFTIPMGISYTIRYLPANQMARFVPAAESVFLLEGPQSNERIAITAERNIGKGDLIQATSDSTQGILNLINDEEPLDEQVVGSLHIYAGTELEILRLSRPFFESWSDEPYQVALRLKNGQARLFTNSGNARPLSVQLETPHGTVQLATGSYQISVEELRTDVTVIDGQAELLRAQESITVDAGQRAWMTTDTLLQEVAPATQNLIANSDFSPPALDNWTPSKSADPDVVLGNVYFQERDGRRVAYFIRQDLENQHNEVTISQQVDKRVDVYNSLVLEMDVNILFHNLPGAGYVNTEFPLRVEISYTDQYGKDLAWGHGFYYRDPEPPGPSVVSGGLQLPQAQWHTYRTPNLIALLDSGGTRPSRINSIRIYASGWNYQSMVSQVYLYAE